jgi:IrrE N-terminal-like domain
VSGYSTLAVRRDALQRAARLLEELAVDQTQPIDVFAVIRRLGAWLTFVPLRNLLGSFVPAGSGGVMITTERQPAVQRYTAAHEIAHIVLDHNLSLDGEAAVFAPAGPERERVAQLFAAYFIMPPPLIFSLVS